MSDELSGGGKPARKPRKKTAAAPEVLPNLLTEAEPATRITGKGIILGHVHAWATMILALAVTYCLTRLGPVAAAFEGEGVGWKTKLSGTTAIFALSWIFSHWLLRNQIPFYSLLLAILAFGVGQAIDNSKERR